MKVEKVKIISDMIRSWLGWIILIIASIVFCVQYKKASNKPTQTITITKEIEVPKIVEVLKWKEKIIYRDVIPDTVFLDTNQVDLETLYYPDMWGILEVKKEGRRMTATAFRNNPKDTEMSNLMKYSWKVRTGNSYGILPTKNAQNPFLLREKRSWVKSQFGFGWSANNWIYLAPSIHFQELEVKGMLTDVALIGFLSFKRQDLRLEFNF